MPLVRSSDQPSKSLEEFYQDLSRNHPNGFADKGARMLELIARVHDAFPETTLYGLTSIDRLVIQNADDWRSDWYVIVSSAGADAYDLEYLLPEARCPWPGATVRGEAASLEDAFRYLLIAMRESEGWVGNAELEGLLQQHAPDRPAV